MIDDQERKPSTFLDSVDLDHHVHRISRSREAAGGEPNQTSHLPVQSEGMKDGVEAFLMPLLSM